MNEPTFSALYGEILKKEELEDYLPLAAEFEELTKRLLAFNAHTNITAITDPDGIIERHYADCLKIAPLIKEGARLLDVGCGGGFPTLPLAIARKDLSITSLDSTAKKLTFVKDTATGMGLRVTTLAGRAEELSKGAPLRESFDAVSARAVASLPVLCEWCLPFLKVGGYFYAMKGSAGLEELKSAENAVKTLGGQVAEIREDYIEGVVRYNILIKKVKSTPAAYPRNGGAIKKKPL